MVSYSKKRLFLASIILLVVVSGGVYYYYQNQLSEVYFTNIVWSPEIIRKNVPVTFSLNITNKGMFDKKLIFEVFLEKVCHATICRQDKIGEFTVTVKRGSVTQVNYTYSFPEEGFYHLIFRSSETSLRQLIYVSPGKSSQSVFRFAVFGDNRPPDAVTPQPAVFKELIRELNLIRPEFAILVGDVIYGYRSDIARLKWQWSDFMSIYDSSIVPIFVAPGNHEMQTEELPESGNPEAQALYVMHLGRLYFAFEYGNSLFIILDTDMVGHASEISGEQLIWLERILKEYRNDYEHVFVFMHKPVISYEGADILNNHDEILPILIKYKVTAVFQGHNHAYYYERVNGTDFYVTGGAGAPLYLRPESGGINHFLIVTVNGTSYDVQFLPIPAIEVADSGNSIRVKYQFDSPYYFRRYDYSWVAEPKPLLLQGMCFSYKSGEKMTIENVLGIIEEDNIICGIIKLKPGEEKTVYARRE